MNPRISSIVSTMISLIAIGLVSAAPAGDRIALQSGPVHPGRDLPESTHGSENLSQRWIVKLDAAPGRLARNLLEVAGVRVDAPLPDAGYLVTVTPQQAAALEGIPGVAWRAPFLPQDKLAPSLEELTSLGDVETALVVHLFRDADARALAEEFRRVGTKVVAARGDSRFGRLVVLVPAMSASGVAENLAQHNDVYWIDRRRPRKLANDTSIWVSQSGLDGGMATPVFDQGLFGEGQLAAVLDTGLDADACYFRDGVLGLPPTNLSGGTVVDLGRRKIVAVDFLDPAENPADPLDWDTQGHGTHVAGILAGDDLATPLVHDAGDGMAPGAKLIIQDAGFGTDACGDLPGIGCPVTDLNPVFQQAYDQGARVHSNSWNDNENAAVQNNYSDASQDVDEFMWNHPDFLVVFAIGNNAFGGDGTMGSPSTAKNTLTTGATYRANDAWALSDISAWGPTDDGRIKPDVVFPGASIQSSHNDGDVTTNNCATQGSTGTSMAAPGVSGMALLTREYFEDGFYPTGTVTPADAFTPSAALLKAMLINSAVPIDVDSQGNPITVPSNEQGWGRVLLDNALYFAGDNRRLWVEDHAVGFDDPSDPPIVFQLEVTDATEPVKVTLVWTDFPSTPAAGTHLVNDLDLRVDGPTGSFHGNAFFAGSSTTQGQPDRVNNVEQVLFSAPAPGVYAIRISPHAIPAGPQPWALVVTGGEVQLTTGPRPGYFSHVIDDASTGGNGDGILDPGESALIPVSLFNAGDVAANGTVAALHSATPHLLKIYGAPVFYGDIQPGQQQSAAGPHYEVTLEPSASCGDLAAANIALSGAGFALKSGFSLPTGLDHIDFPSTDTPVGVAKTTDGAWSFNAVPDDFFYSEIDVTLNIDHQDISELQVILYSPPNSAINLHRFTDPGVSGIHTTYDDDTAPHGPGVMDDFLDLGPSGSWRIRVIDQTGGGTPAGELEDWTLHFRDDFPFNCHPVGCAEGVPASVGNTLTAVNLNGDVQLNWGAAGGSPDYNVWRSDDARFQSATHLVETSSTTFTDAASAASGVQFYLVRSVNSCRWESVD